jgi:hypothetical protein
MMDNQVLPNSVPQVDTPELLQPQIHLLLYLAHSAARRGARSVPGETSACLDLGLPDSFNLQRKAETPGERTYAGSLTGGEQLELSWTLVHDSHLLRLKLSLAGDQPLSSWSRLQSLLDGIVNDAWEQPANPRPWAATYLYCAALPKSLPAGELQHLLPHPDGLSQQEPGEPDTTAFGWLWLLDSGEHPLPDRSAYWQRRLALLYPSERAQKVHTYFIDPLSQGLPRIELYLQKSLHHTRQAERVRTSLITARYELQKSVLEAMETVDFSQLQSEKEELETISQGLMRFLTQKATVDVLLNTLGNNRSAFNDHLQRVRLQTPLYDKEGEILERAVQQLESDLRNAQVVVESTTVFQDIQRGVESSRLERASFLMGASAGLLAGIFTFNSFLDIWNLALEGSGLLLPPVWVRILLGLIAGVSLPLAATWIVERRKRHAALAIILGVSSILLAVVTTYIANI